MSNDPFPKTWFDKSMNHNAQIDEACASGICSQGQNLGHMPRIYHICTKLKPKVILETGIGDEGHGSSTYTFLVIAKEMNVELYSFDTAPQNIWFQKRHPTLDFSHWHFQEVQSVKGIQDLALVEPELRVDFVHLDSDHGGGYVSQEIEAVEPLLADVHVITSHDTEQKPTHTALTDYAIEHNYVVKYFGDWHGQTFITNKPDLLEGLV